MAKAPKENKDEPLEKQLWKAADKLRKNIDAAEYKHVVMGLIFLKYISDSFEEMFARLQAGEGEYAGADPEDKDEYKAENIFFVPSEARWSFLVAKAKLPTIGTVVDEAMDAIEKENPSLKGVLPKVFARQNLDPASLGGLIDLAGNIALGDAKSRSADVLGHVFEYFLGEFALAEGKRAGSSIRRAALWNCWWRCWSLTKVESLIPAAARAACSCSRNVVTPGCYVGLPDEEDDFNFAERFAAMKAEFEEQLLEEAELNKAIAVVLTQRVRENASIDWTIKENVRAKLKVIVKRTLRQFGYPPDMQLLATETVLKQAEMIAEELAG